MQLDYVVWETAKLPNVCSLSGLEGVPKIFELKDGISRAHGFPEEARFQMSPTYPYDIQLADCLKNAERLLVGSPHLKEFLESRGVESVEYLSVTILNHKGRVAAGNYYIIHLTDPIDCLDIPRCGATHSSLVPEDIMDVQQVVLDSARIDPARRVFRVRYYNRPVFVRRDLAREIESSGFSGIRCLELDEYSRIK